MLAFTLKNVGVSLALGQEVYRVAKINLASQVIIQLRFRNNSTNGKHLANVLLESNHYFHHLYFQSFKGLHPN